MFTLQEEIGMRLADLRMSHHLTQQQFAEKMDISIKHCSHVERGVSCFSIEKLIQVSRFYQVSLDYILTGKNLVGNQEIIPDTVLTILQSSDEKEKQYFTEYINMYQMIRSLPSQSLKKD